MKIHYVYFSESDKHSNILEDYFAFHYPFQFSINKSNILKKHGSYLEAKTFPTFEKRLQKIGYAETKYEQCDSCSQLFKISSRSELEFLYKSLGSHCKTCREKSSYANIIEAQETYISVTDDFFYIYNNNTAFPNTQKRKKRYSYPEITTQLQSLSILDLIYLHEICDKLSFSTGRLKLKEFAIFSYAENFNDNSHIINLLLEGLLFW